MPATEQTTAKTKTIWNPNLIEAVRFSWETMSDEEVKLLPARATVAVTFGNIVAPDHTLYYEHLTVLLDDGTMLVFMLNKTKMISRKHARMVWDKLAGKNWRTLDDFGIVKGS